MVFCFNHITNTHSSITVYWKSIEEVGIFLPHSSVMNTVTYGLGCFSLERQPI